MTLLISWVGKDSRKISSFYIASDSRISWNKGTHYDYSQKVFAFSNSPDILGYCGDVMYPSQALSQLRDMDKERILFPSGSDRFERSQIIYEELQKKFNEYPAHKVMKNSLQIIHASRDNEVNFFCNLFTWTPSNGWSMEEKEIPDGSDKVIVLGTGANEYIDRYLEYYKGFNGKTSRALFQSLCHSLLKIKDLQCGGAPQLVGLYNRFSGRNFGIIYENKRYFLGSEVRPAEDINKIEWRNELFERYDGNKIKILDGAQRQPDELRP